MLFNYQTGIGITRSLYNELCVDNLLTLVVGFPKDIYHKTLNEYSGKYIMSMTKKFQFGPLQSISSHSQPQETTALLSL